MSTNTVQTNRQIKHAINASGVYLAKRFLLLCLGRRGPVHISPDKAQSLPILLLRLSPKGLMWIIHPSTLPSLPAVNRQAYKMFQCMLHWCCKNTHRILKHTGVVSSLRSRTWCRLERKIIPNSYFDSVVCDRYSHDHVPGKPLEWKTILTQSWEISVISTVCKDNHFKHLKLRWEQTCRRTLEKSAGETCMWAVIQARLMLCTVPSKRRG